MSVTIDLSFCLVSVKGFAAQVTILAVPVVLVGVFLGGFCTILAMSDYRVDPLHRARGRLQSSCLTLLNPKCSSAVELQGGSGRKQIDIT